MFRETEILAFALILLRVSAFMFAWPLFSLYNVPAPLKVLLALSVAMLLFPAIDHSALAYKGLDQDIAWLGAKEVLTGLCLGFLTRLFFFALSVGGNLIATSAGMANGQLFNPSLGASTTTVEQFYATIGTLLFLSLNGHHYFLTGLARSFDAVPIAFGGTGFALQTHMTNGLSQLIGRYGESGLILQQITEAGIKIAAPVLITIFMLNIVMGVISRAIPQVNVLVTSMSVNFLAALAVMILAVPALIMQLDREILAFAETLFKFMKAM